MVRRFAANKVLLPEGFVRNTIIDIDDRGVITDIIRDSRELDSERCVEFYNGVIISAPWGCCDENLCDVVVGGLITANLGDSVIEIGERVRLVLIDDVNFTYMTFGEESRAIVLF